MPSININQISHFFIHSDCTQGNPCSHQCAVYLKDERVLFLELSGEKILIIINSLNPCDLDVGGADSSHFRGFEAQALNSDFRVIKLPSRTLLERLADLFICCLPRYQTIA